jgi:hypothetical protein
MLKNTNKYQTLLAVCLLTLLACSTNETLTDSPIDQSKTPIELTAGIIGENAATTRGLTRTVTNTAEAFSKGTSLYMVIKSENGTSTTPTQFTRTIGYAQELATTPESSTATGFASTYKRYWEDTQSPARDSKLSIYAACVPDYYLPVSVYPNITPNGTADGTTPWSIGGSTDYSNDWNASLGATTIAWPLRGTAVGSQDATFLANQDLCFSNNVSKQSTTVDNRLKFDDDTKKFTSGRMVFHHALTKVTFKIKKGNGFGSDSFAFTYADATSNPENIVLVGFNTSGTFNIANGEFLTESPAIGTGDIKVMSLTDHRAETNPDFEYELTCLMLPGSTLNGSDKDALDKIYFTIDENKYHITKSQLAGALASKTLTDNSTSALDEYKMRPGVHYIFTMTVSKSQISNLSAAVVPWEEVTASTTPSNARISVSLLENGTAETSTTPTFDLFRSANVNEGAIDDNYTSYTWAKGYEKATLSYNSTTGAYVAYNLDGTTPWYWPNNRTFYHFRTLKPQTTNTWKVETGGTNPNTFEYVTLEGGLFNDTPEYSYRDVCWGAPFKSLGSGQKLTYSLTTGFDNTGTGDLTDPANHQISKAIGPTTSTINMNTFHMMSDVTINLTTTTGSDKVTLTGATVKLTPVYNTGTVRMGNGLINTTGSTGDITGTVSDVDGQSYKQWRYGFVPQSLESVVLTITTTDHNQYIVNMKDVVANTVSDNIIANPYTATSSKINRWYPNFSYTYTFHLTKTGIEKVTATLAAWGAVTADPQTVQIQ